MGAKTAKVEVLTGGQLGFQVMAGQKDQKDTSGEKLHGSNPL